MRGSRGSSQRTEGWSSVLHNLEPRSTNRPGWIEEATGIDLNDGMGGGFEMTKQIKIPRTDTKDGWDTQKGGIHRSVGYIEG